MIRWWCSAQGLAWTWDWQPYVGVWLAVGMLAGGYLWLRRGSGDEPGIALGRPARFAAGLILLWLALDWPIGLLAAGYLATAHVIQFLVITLIVAPLLLSAIPPAAFRALARRPLPYRLVQVATHPALTLAGFTTVMILSHLPAVTDPLKASPAGNFAMDTGWLVAGLLLWWPVLRPLPGRRIHPLARMGYLLVISVPGTALGMFLAFAEYPQFAVYELAPRVPGLTLSVTADQRLAGLLMKFGAGIVIWTVVSVMFFRWYAEEEAAGRAATRTAVPARHVDPSGPRS